MPTIFQEIDTAAVCGLSDYGSGLGLLADTTFTEQATLGGTPGSTAKTVILLASQTDQVACNWEIPAASLFNLSWLAGTWTVNINITTSNANCFPTSVWVCRVSSVCGNISVLGHTTANQTGGGVHAVNVVCSGVSVPDPNDKIIVVVGASNSLASSQSFQITGTATIVSPFSTPVPGPEDESYEYLIYSPRIEPLRVSLWG